MATPTEECFGGGGAGGRVAIHYTADEYTGTILSHGGAGLECGGAGTVLRKDTGANTVKLLVDNGDICSPLDAEVGWSSLSDTNRGQNSFLTWLYDQEGSHTHEFEVSSLVLDFTLCKKFNFLL